jgi:hypothetical protein
VLWLFAALATLLAEACFMLILFTHLKLHQRYNCHFSVGNNVGVVGISVADPLAVLNRRQVEILGFKHLILPQSQGVHFRDAS